MSSPPRASFAERSRRTHLEGRIRGSDRDRDPGLSARSTWHQPQTPGSDGACLWITTPASTKGSESGRDRHPGRAAGFIARNIVCLPKREGDLVPTVEEAFAKERVDVKGGFERARCYPLVHQIDGDLYAWFLHSHIDQPADLGFRELDRE